MRLYLTTILFIIFEQINKIFTQTMPMSPCPKMFQYRFDGSEWFGVLSVRNPDYVHALHLKVTLSMRGKPATNYLGEIELLTRGQFRNGMPVLYKVKFPKTHLPPRLLQIVANNQVICLGAADQSMFVTQIILEHTRKFTFIANFGNNNDDSIQPLAPNYLSPSALGDDDLTLAALDANSDELTTESGGILPAAHAGFANRHFQFKSTFEKKPMRGLQAKCGRIDERIHFQIEQAMSPRRQRTNLHNTPLPNEKNMGTAGEQGLHQIRSGINNGNAGVIPLIIDGDDDFQTTHAEHNNGGGTLWTTQTSGTTTDMQNELPSVTRGAWPWLAAVYVNNLTSLAYQCGGTLVSSRMVISSAHCFHMYQKRYTANEVLVFLGRHNLRNWNEEGSLAAPVDDIFIHPDYDSHLNSYDADIAVVLLKHETRFNTFIRPACMWSGSTKLQYIEGELGIVVGWGLANFDTINANANEPRASAVPRIVSAPIVTNDVCFSANTQYHSLSSNRTFCAGTVTTKTIATIQRTTVAKASQQNTQLPMTETKSNSELCTGDSGAGLMIYKNNRWMLRGTVSASLAQTNKDQTNSKKDNNNCNSNQYVIYTDVGKFLDWIYAFII